MSTPDWRQFFATHGDYDIPVHYYESERTVSVEELYQAFKARLAFELWAERTNDLRSLG